ncbi:ABC transporter ATP-binding protein uup [Vibrio stylophorae]|uniref:ATP-binding protein Uup n=1 Tax=Vibrio stylophorae TaxID=659351 RepID=A0ABM8ZT46_9VIBR|nr:ABC transporter ATP-binding protein [Vibrio stylophorae]CAH0533476.1 ABC transporter ATP-binding protein uup [Vibrio stylophorae]
MALITISQGQLAFGDNPLLSNAEFVLQPQERVCLVGRNGAGKSTLMKVLAKQVIMDDGTLWFAQDLKVSRLEQDPPRDVEGTVFDFVSEGLADVGQALAKYHQLLELVAQNAQQSDIDKLAKQQELLETLNAWHFDNQINMVLAELGLSGNTKLTDLSGGWQRKAALARALVCEPDVLLLDEPTNHLDVDAIEWLENYLKQFRGAIIFVSHDRAFIQSMATRIVDLDRGNLTSWPGDYQTYLDGKEEVLRVEAEQNALFDKKLAQEEVWIRQGIKARRTRNEGRVRALKALRVERSQRIESQGKAKLQLDDAVRSGKIVFEIEDLNYQIEDKHLISDFSVNVQRGDKIALIGPNGCGKSTLIKLLLGELKTQQGRLHCGTKLEVAYFDQYREELDPEKTVMDNLADGKQEVMVAGRSRHALGYLQDFLFHPRRARTPVKALSGGERNRLLLAKLFLKPCNLLVLDEPTNDLDIETLELLEDLLAQYEGTLILVSHDRQFVDNTVTHSWIFEGNGVIQSYVGGYHDARQQQLQSKQAVVAKPVAKVEEKTEEKKEKRNSSSKKLSYKLQRELEALPEKLEQLESQLESLQSQVNDPAFFQQDQTTTQAVLTELATVETELEAAFERWETLEAMQQESES